MDLSIKSNRVVMFLITWFFGIFGIHWFIQKNYTKGFLYLISIGGFFVCWIYDIVKCFINIFNYNPNYLALNKKTIKNEETLKDTNKYKNVKDKEIANRALLFQRKIEILNDCGHLMESTKNPDVYFPRLKLYWETLEWLAENESEFNLIGELPSEKLAKVKENSVKDINEFIDKYYQEIVSKINSLKTLNAKKNNCDKFRATLEQYDMYMNKENINHYNDLYSSLYESLN